MNRAGLTPKRAIPAQTYACHLVGGATSFILCLATVWLAVTGVTIWEPRDAAERNRRLREAARLVRDQEQWRLRHEAALTERRQLDRRGEAIGDWLDTQPDTAGLENALRLLARDCGVKVQRFERQKSQVGARVGVMPCVARIRGSYGDVCRLLHRLGDGRRAVWCAGIRLRRESADPNSPIGTPSRCSAVLDLRVPYAATDSPVGQLFAQGT